MTRDEMLDNARSAAIGHLATAVKEIDARFGEGSAKASPQLVAAFLQACALSEVASGLEVAGWAIGNGLASR